MIKEVVVVEGKDDITAVKNAIDVEVISTHGFGYGKKLIHTLKKISKRSGIIIFTDPDYMGKKIRQDLTKYIPEAKQAYLPRKQALRQEGNKVDVGIENASSEDIVQALLGAKPTYQESKVEYTKMELMKKGLIGGKNSEKIRGELCDILGIGHCNGKQLLNKLNSFAIEKEEFEEAFKKVKNEG